MLTVLSVPCGKLRAPDNGDFETEVFALFRCKLGYGLVGDALLMCSPDTCEWSNDIPVCTAGRWLVYPSEVNHSVQWITVMPHVFIASKAAVAIIHSSRRRNIHKLFNILSISYSSNMMLDKWQKLVLHWLTYLPAGFTFKFSF